MVRNSLRLLRSDIAEKTKAAAMNLFDENLKK